MTFENKSCDEKSTEKTTSKIIDTNDCNNNNDKTLLNQALKNQLLEVLINDKKAKGVINKNTFKITYLSE